VVVTAHVKTGPESTGAWPCIACTFINHPSAVACEICSTPSHNQTFKAAPVVPTPTPPTAVHDVSPLTPMISTAPMIAPPPILSTSPQPVSTLPASPTLTKPAPELPSPTPRPSTGAIGQTNGSSGTSYSTPQRMVTPAPTTAASQAMNTIGDWHAHHSTSPPNANGNHGRHSHHSSHAQPHVPSDHEQVGQRYHYDGHAAHQFDYSRDGGYNGDQFRDVSMLPARAGTHHAGIGAPPPYVQSIRPHQYHQQHQEAKRMISTPLSVSSTDQRSSDHSDDPAAYIMRPKWLVILYLLTLFALLRV
jgi:hypothetical protein